MKPINLGLVSRTLLSMQDKFQNNGHCPSSEQWDALADLVNCLDGMARGTAEKTVYVCSLDPGLGKTTALKCYVDQLLTQQLDPYSDVGCLICLNTIDEVQRLIEEIGIPKDMLAVWTSRDDLNRLGRSDRENARVLITTHARVLQQTSNTAFWTADKLYYKGSVRKLRVWDEEFLPGSPISLSVDDVMTTLKRLHSVSPELRDSIKTAFDEIDLLPDRSVYVMPDYMRDTGNRLNDLLRSIAHLRKSSLRSSMRSRPLWKP
jgi:hypothetical protein